MEMQIGFLESTQKIKHNHPQAWGRSNSQLTTPGEALETRKTLTPDKTTISLRISNVRLENPRFGPKGFPIFPNTVVEERTSQHRPPLTQSPHVPSPKQCEGEVFAPHRTKVRKDILQDAPTSFDDFTTQDSEDPRRPEWRRRLDFSRAPKSPTPRHKTDQALTSRLLERPSKLAKLSKQTKPPSA